MINLDELSLGDLKKLQKDVEKAIASFTERQKRATLAAAEAAVKENGVQPGRTRRHGQTVTVQGGNRGEVSEPREPGTDLERAGAEAWLDSGGAERWQVVDAFLIK